MLSEQIQKDLNEQINHEMYSSYLYLGLSYAFEKSGLLGFAHWFKLQSEEEWRHALKIADYVLDCDGTTDFQDIKAPAFEFGCPCEAMIAALEHEQGVTKRIHTIMKTARSAYDYGTCALMSWFVQEQIEEEATLRGIIQPLERIDGDANGIIFMDKKLHERTT